MSIIWFGIHEKRLPVQKNELGYTDLYYYRPADDQLYSFWIEILDEINRQIDAQHP